MKEHSYKSYLITESANGRFYVSAMGFNPEGYATLNNAKGAITKHLNKQALGKAIDAGLNGEPDKFPWAERTKAATNDKASHATVYPTDEACYQQEAAERYAAEHPLEVATGMPFADEIQAIRQKTVIPKSRNRREGRLDGKRAGKMLRGLRGGKPAALWSRNSTPLNRKQRKIERLGGYYSPSILAE